MEPPSAQPQPKEAMEQPARIAEPTRVAKRPHASIVGAPNWAIDMAQVHPQGAANAPKVASGQNKIEWRGAACCGGLNYHGTPTAKANKKGRYVCGSSLCRDDLPILTKAEQVEPRKRLAAFLSLVVKVGEDTARDIYDSRG